VFVIQMTQKTSMEVEMTEQLLDLVNINAVTAHAGPQSLIVVEITGKYYFYRDIANRDYLNTSTFIFGDDVTAIIESAGLASLLDQRVKRMVNLREENTVLLPKSGVIAQPTHLKAMFGELTLDQIKILEDDISGIVPQLQVLLPQNALVDLSRDLVSVLPRRSVMERLL